MSFDEISLTNRVLDLRESSADGAALVTGLRELSLSANDAAALATALEDRFVSPEERLDLLGRLELHGTLDTGSTVSGFLSRLAGADGREASRHHARALAAGLAPSSTDGERVAMSADSFRELAAALPSSSLGVASSSPVTYGMYLYLAPHDSAMVALAAEIRGNWESSTDPVLRMRSARVLAESGDARAANFLRESQASFAIDYRGELSMDERIARAAGLAIDGNAAAAAFLQRVAMNPEESLARRSRALEYLPPQSLDNGSDTAEVFRSLVEDPEEPVPTRYLMMSVLARSPHPPEADWWRRRIDDPTMVVSDRAASGSTGPGNSDAEFSQWNLVIAALGSSRADFATDLLRDMIDNRGAPVATRREALMAYLQQSGGRGSLPWSTLREVLALPAGDWDGLLGEVADGLRPLRLRFPRERTATAPFSLGSSERVVSEIVLEVRPRGEGDWEWQVDLRPRNPAQDAEVASSDPAPAEFRLPLNRRITLGGLSPEDIAAEVAMAAPVGPPAGSSAGAGGAGPEPDPSGPTRGGRSRENGQLSNMGMGI